MLKYKMCLLFLFNLLLLNFNFIRTDALINDLPLFGKVIYIDPGHGGTDPGAVYKDIYEKNINLSISKELETKLTSLGAIVYLTRYGDYDLSVTNTINRKRSDLSRRGNVINKSNCDLFLSIHLNSEETGIWSGAQVFYDDNNVFNEKIANIFQSEFNSNLGSKREYKLVDDLYLQKRITRPGILIEVGFLSNASDRYLLKQVYYQKKVASVITNGVLKYFNIK
ncbi:MAG: N-acetylmuramoyl-L-alanine amidase [Bacilli bacterium]